jgi:glycosyltransferase involved in cell wall biosynthesis
MQNKTLLIMFPSQFRGGTEEYALLISSEAMKQGWNVHAAFPETMGTVSVIKDFANQGVIYHPLKIHEYDEFWLETRPRHALRFIRTIMLLHSLKPDVVQINLPYLMLSPAPILACAVMNIPTAVVFHLTPQKIAVGRNRIKAYLWAKRRNQQWITVSEYNRKIVCETFQIAAQEVLRIYNGTRIQEANIYKDQEQIRTLRLHVRQKLGLTPESQLILTVGRLHPQKGYQDIIPIIPHVIKDMPKVKFIWAGEGEYRNYLITKLREYQVEEHVILLGHRADILSFLQAADLFLFPTHYEGLPFAIIEAMAAGLPVIVSDATSIPEIIEHEVHGLLFRTADSSSLLETLRWALSHSDKMQVMAQKAMFRAHNFNQEQMIHNTLDILQHLYVTKHKGKSSSIPDYAPHS